MSKDNMNTQVVVAYFDSADAADAAASALMNWDKANEDIKLGAIGRLTQSEKGKLKSKRYDKSRTGRDALIGGAVGLVAAGLTGGLSLLAGTLGGGAVGGAVGALTHESFGLTDANMEKVQARLDAGGAALVVLCDDFEIEPTMEQLRAAGGEVHSFGVSSKVLEAIHQHSIDKTREDTAVRSIEEGGVG
jgi:uncharacterized membrane protein